MAGLGDSLMLPKPGHPVEHLWVVITKPHPQTNGVIMVNVTTQRPHSDTTTILHPGDHPFIQKPSVIFYADARIADTELLDDALRRGACHSHAAFSGTVLAKIQSGLLISKFTPKKIKLAYTDYDAAGLT